MRILDACCGSRMFWFDKDEPHTIYMDIRQEYEELSSGHVIDVDPNVVGDFRDMPFIDDCFDLVIFDPPHLIHAGDNSWLAKKYGKLDKYTWQRDISDGVNECLRVLKPNGTLIFKWNEEQIKLSQILNVIEPIKPILGNKRSKMHWLVFIKAGD